MTKKKAPATWKRTALFAAVIVLGFGVALLLSFGTPGDYTPTTDPFGGKGDASYEAGRATLPP